MDSKLAATQKEVEGVKDIMLENMKKGCEREEKLQDLDKRAEQLLEQGKSFKKSSRKLKEKKRRENLRSKAGLIALVTLLALVIIIVVAVMLSSQSSSNTHNIAMTPKPHTVGQP